MRLVNSGEALTKSDEGLMKSDSTYKTMHTHVCTCICTFLKSATNMLLFTEETLRFILTNLPQDKVDSCVRYFTSGAMNMSDEQKWKKVTNILW